jgi:hypothetical protein
LRKVGVRPNIQPQRHPVEESGPGDEQVQHADITTDYVYEEPHADIIRHASDRRQSDTTVTAHQHNDFPSRCTGDVMLLPCVNCRLA